MKAELDRFCGTWMGVSVTQDGTEIAKAEAEQVRLTVAGEVYALQTGDEVVKGTDRLDPAK